VFRVFVSPSVLAPRGLPAVLGIALAVVLSAVGARACSTAYADHLASAISAGLLNALTPLIPSAEADSSEPEQPEPGSSETETASVRSAAATGKQARVPARSHALTAQHGIRVSSAQVLALAARRAMPQAVPVKANAQHPAGLLLRGVSALGVGLQDGDVLTEAAGQRASSLAVVVGVVLAARGRQAPEISGRFYRAGVPFGLTVEQPYPKQAILAVPG